MTLNRFADPSLKEPASPAIRPGSMAGTAFEHYETPTWRERARGIKRELLTYREAARPKAQPGHPEIKFCVFAPGRSGSTLLFDLANAHPDVQCEKDAKETELLRDRFLLPLRYVEARARLSPAKVYGFKLQLNHLTSRNPTDPQRFIHKLSDNGWKMIYLTRRDILRQTISLTIAQQTQIWHRVQTAEGKIERLERNRADWEKVDLSLELLHSLLAFQADNLKYTDAIMSDIPHLKLVYEDNLFTAMQQTQTMTQVFAYLGIPPYEAKTRFVRTSKDNLRDMLGNFDEVIASLRGTAYEEFLSENDLHGH